MNPWYFIAAPFFVILAVLYVCTWVDAYDHYKTFGCPLKLIFQSITSIFIASIAYGFYLLIISKP